MIDNWLLFFFRILLRKVTACLCICNFWFWNELFSKLLYIFWHVMRRNFWTFPKIYFTFYDSLDLVQRHDAKRLRGGQWTVSTPLLRGKACFRVLFSQWIELCNWNNIRLNCNKKLVWLQTGWVFGMQGASLFHSATKVDFFFVSSTTCTNF